LRFDEFMRRGRPILDEFLAEQGITQTEFVFNTGDAGLYSLPFLYMNTERHLLVFVRHVPLRPVAVNTVPGLKRIQAFGHVLQSHLVNLIQRPVSSLYRLFFVITDTTVSTLSFDWTTALSNKPVPAVGDLPPMDLQLWERDLDKISSRRLSSGKVDILIDGEAFFTRFIDTLTTAKKSVQMQTYIFDNDDYAVKIAELLKRRSNEGVDVKVLLDGLGTISGTMADSQSLPEHHTPPDSVRFLLESDSQVNVRQKANPWFTGDHVKSTIIDHQVAFVGGMNIGREYRYDWHDLMMEIQGPVVDILRREFQVAWAHAGPLGDLGYLFSLAKRIEPIERNKLDQDYPLRVLLTSTGNHDIYKTQLKAIRRAQSYIYIQNAYFTDDTLLRELVLARRRGVDVRVIVPMETDHGPINRSNVLAVNIMLEHGIRVFMFPGFSHVKAAIYDGWVCVGSANFDRLSLHLNRELNISSSDPEVAEQLLERLFEPDFRSSPELTEPIPERWVDHLVEIVADYIY
jgi:cardiolipin synthase